LDLIHFDRSSSRDHNTAINQYNLKKNEHCRVMLMLMEQELLLAVLV